MNSPTQPQPKSGTWDSINCDHQNPYLLLQKQLTPTDIDPKENRIFLNKKLIEDNLFPMVNQIEKSSLLGKGLSVDAFDQAGWKFYMAIKQLPSNEQFTFKTEWRKIVKKNGWEVNDTVCIWAFRRGGKLCIYMERQ